MTKFHFFLWLSNILLYKYTTPSSSIHLLICTFNEHRGACIFSTSCFYFLWVNTLPHLSFYSPPLFFGSLEGIWDLSFPTRDQTCTPWLKARNLNHWTAREVPILLLLIPSYMSRLLTLLYSHYDINCKLCKCLLLGTNISTLHILTHLIHITLIR